MTTIEIRPGGKVFVDGPHRVDVVECAENRIVLTVADDEEWDEDDVITVTEMIAPLDPETARRFAERGAL